MYRLTALSLVLILAPHNVTAQRPPPPPPSAPHDTVRGAIRVVDTGARSLEVTTGVGFALRVVRLQVPADVPVSDRSEGAEKERIGFAELKPGDVIRAVFGLRQTRFVAYTIERLGRMETGAEPAP
jgi:hypothetical protein